MDTHTMVRLTLLACGMAIGLLSVCNADRTIIRNEDDLIDTCTKTCDRIPELHGRDQCTKISGCRFNSKGWNSGFVRCDYCACECKENLDGMDILVEEKPLSVMEKDLFGTCKNSCNKAGLVRTDFRDCQEVRDCFRSGKGKLCGFFKNDFCTCTCRNQKFAVSYELKDIVYETDEAVLHNDPPVGLEQVDLINEDPNSSNSATAILGLRYIQTQTMEASQSMQLGLTVAVSVGLSIEIISLEQGLEFSYTNGYTYTEGSSESEEREYSVTATIIVPPASTTTAKISGSVVKIDVPYTATLVTTYEDESTSEKPIEGIYTDVETAMFTVKYEEPVPIGSLVKIDVDSATLVTTYEDGSISEKPTEGIYTDVEMETEMFTVKYEEPVL